MQRRHRIDEQRSRHLNTAHAISFRTPPRIILVLGMHRSGTSCLTGSLQQAGLVLGEFSEWNPHNLKGNRENTEIMTLNESVLKASGGSWDAPPRRVKWLPVYKMRARAILDKYADNPLWGFKDPRSLLTLDGWLECGIEPQYIGIFRHPDAVAGSLMRRNGDAIDRRRALELWYAYNRRLLQLYKKKPFPLLCFDWPEADFHRALDKALLAIGLAPAPDGERFYTSELVHQTAAKSRLPWKVGRLYRKLRAISEQYQ